MMDILVCKKKVRQKYKSLIAGLHNQRRFEAAQQLLHSLYSYSSSFPYILSFSSFRYEIHTHLLNTRLAREGRLLLPRVVDGKIHIYLVSDLHCQLIKNNLGILEPNPSLCTLMKEDRVSMTFVPGLAFDEKNYRIGYGKGMYDCLLPNLHGEKIGIGFKEQACTCLPQEPHDIPLSNILLF
jgi:5-formyltetrahydrofolate cyclo-ligase